ncbi:hypothetical protein B0H10DRAFT_1942079 [Mycena sp. CBHHK59/15]|nr:hypothetical protein B0H10DRAFT_1942079 [Mycena sp. CBHHK59/15]
MASKTACKAPSASLGTPPLPPSQPAIPSSHRLAIPSSFTAPCPGLLLAWDADTFWETYPFQIHSPKSKHCAKYELLFSEPPRARSKECLGAIVTAHGSIPGPCAKCSALNFDISSVKEQASRSFEHVHDHSGLNMTQLHAKVMATNSLNTLKLKNLNLLDSLSRARERLEEFTDVIEFIGKNAHAIPALHRLLANTAEYGWSAKRILEHCKLAVDGKYTARNYTQYEIDLAILLYELGGGGAVYAMNHSIFALPSRNTIQPYRRHANLMPSLNGVRVTDISGNISALFGPRESHGGASIVGTAPTGTPTIFGHTLSFDEIATERKIDYMTATDDMGGFCLEHLSALDSIKVGKDTQTVQAAVGAVREGKVHISHETSVGAISCLSETGYGARPVFMGPSCKTGTWKDCLRTMEIVLEIWKRSLHGERLHGPILSIASDGDAKRCLALFTMCMHSEIVPGKPLYPFICDLPGLNRHVGKNNITMELDPKHEFKRGRTLLCLKEGLIVKNTCVNCDLLLSWLEYLTGYDWSETSLHALLDPADGRNVSGAIKLMLCIVELRNLNQDDFDPSEAAEFEDLCLLGEIFDAWLQPFINTELSLSEQIESLIKCSHLLCALYLQNSTAFMSNQLYAVIQASIKSAILMVPKTRLINGKLKVFICLLRDDVLEALFGRSRMIGGHSPNCSVGELHDRFVSAMNLDFIYEQHPEFERQPCRLNLFRMHHVDHLWPTHFKRELCADSCDLNPCWKAAVSKAEAILAKYGVQMAMLFANLFKRKDTDLLRPFGGKYPAISNDVDRSMVNSSSSIDLASEIDPSTIDPPNLMATVNFDAMFASNMDSLPDTPPHSLFAEINANGQQAHKKTIVRTFFEMTHDNHTSHDRLQHVRGFTIGGKSWAREKGEANQSISPSTHFQLSNLFTSLICYNTTHLALAIAKCTLIKKAMPGSKSTSVSAVARAELHLPDSPYTMSGQVFSVVPLATSSACAWDGNFILFSLKKKSQKNGDEISCLCNLQFAVSSRLIDSISEGVFPYTTLSSTDSQAICYSSPIAGTVIEELHISHNTCRVCGLAVKDMNRQAHVGQHILKFIHGFQDTSVKFPVSDEYPCGTCAGPTTNGCCTMGIKNGNLESDCPSAYSFMISAARHFRETHPCTNIPIKCPLECNQTHWKYNFQKHLEERHPQWRQILLPSFRSTIEISSAEQRALGIPSDRVVEWPPRNTPPDPPLPPDSPFVQGQKRNVSCLMGSPGRRSNKENEAEASSNPGFRASKMRRLV